MEKYLQIHDSDKDTGLSVAIIKIAKKSMNLYTERQREEYFSDDEKAIFYKEI